MTESPPGRIAFLGMDDLGVYVSDDDLAVPHLAKLDWDVETVPWRTPDPRWERFAAVVIRSPWDYPGLLDDFLATLARIEAAGVPLANPLAQVRANVRKSYLLELAARGCPIPRTVVEPALTRAALEAFARDVGSVGVVAKPVVGASGWEALRVRPEDPASVERALAVLGGRAVVLQPFLPSILGEGELSLIYFSGALSHALIKAPVAGEFRVQEEHGGLIRGVEPDAESVAVADAILRLIDPVPLYARVDLVRDGGRLVLMELELVEPSLYLRTDPDAPARFAAALDRWVRAPARPPLSGTGPSLHSRA